MARKLRIMVAFALIATLTLTILTSCVQIDEKKVAAAKDGAEIYYAEKYGSPVKATESKAVLGYSLFAFDTGDVVIHMEDGTTVIYDGHNDSFSDDHQAQQITDDLNNYYVPKLVASCGLGSNYETTSDDNLGFTFNEYTFSGDNGYEVYLFKELYTGDIEKFLAKEDVKAYGVIRVKFYDYELSYPDGLVQKGETLLSTLMDAFDGTRAIEVFLDAADGSVPPSNGFKYLTNDNGSFALVYNFKTDYYKYLDSGLGYSFAVLRSSTGIMRGQIELSSVSGAESVVTAAYDTFNETQSAKEAADNTTRKYTYYNVDAFAFAYELTIDPSVPTNSTGYASIGIATDDFGDGLETYLIATDGSVCYKISDEPNGYVVSLNTEKTYYLWRGLLVKDNR